MAADKDNRIIKLLACIPRGKPNPQGVPPEELRVTLAEFQGSLYLSLRVFFLAKDDQFYPVAGKGCSVRLGEASDVASALLEGLRIANEMKAANPKPDYAPRQRQRQRQGQADRQRPVAAAQAQRSPSRPRETQLDALDDLAEYRR